MLLRAYICWGQLLVCASLDVHAESPHLGLCSLLYSQFTTIVSASWADSVVDVVSATVWAKCQCWHFCFVVGTTFRLSGVRLSSFWMCHNSYLFYLLFLKLIQPSMLRLATQNCHAIITYCLHILFFIFYFGTKVVLEKCIHFWVATTILVTMHQRKIHYNQFIR